MNANNQLSDFWSIFNIRLHDDYLKEVSYIDFKTSQNAVRNIIHALKTRFTEKSNT